MKNIKPMFAITALFVAFTLSFISAISVDAGYTTLYPGEDGKISVNVDNNENFDIESVSVSLDLSNLPFTSVGSSSKDMDNLNEGDDDSCPGRFFYCNRLIHSDTFSILRELPRPASYAI